MAKRPTLTDITSGFASSTALNLNNTEIEAAFDNTVSRDGSSPNFMLADFDLNSNKLLNVASPTGSLDGVNKAYVDGLFTATAGDSLLSGSDLTFSDKAEAEAADVAPTVSGFYLAGYSSYGDNGGGHYIRVGSEPSHEAKIQTNDGAWWELSEAEVYPEMLGAAADGTTDDITAIHNAIDAALSIGAVVKLRWGKVYGIASPITFTAARSYSGFIGNGPYSENDGDEGPKIKKLSSWSGDAAIIVGDSSLVPGVDDQTVGCRFEGFAIDGNEQDGDGMQWWAGGRHVAERIGSYNNNGWGFRCDGVFFPTYLDCVARTNGSNKVGATAGEGGGLYLSNSIRENADGRWYRGHINLNGNRQLKMDLRAGAPDPYVPGGAVGTDAQSHWSFKSTEIWHANSFRSDAATTNSDAPVVVEILGAWDTTFESCKFIGARADEYVDLMVIGDAAVIAGEWVEGLTFSNCYFQHNSFTDGTPIARFCIEGAGAWDRVRFNDCKAEGSAKFIDLQNVTEGTVYEKSIEIAADRWNDPDRRIRNVEGGWIGPRRGSTAPPTGRFDVAYEDGTKMRVAVNSTGSGDIDFGLEIDGDNDRVTVLSAGVLRLPEGRTAAQLEALSLGERDLVFWDGSGTFSTYTGFTAKGYYVMDDATTGALLIELT